MGTFRNILPPMARPLLLQLLCVLAAVQLSTQQCTPCEHFMDLPELKTSAGELGCVYHKWQCVHDFECSGLERLPDFSKMCPNDTVDDLVIVNSSIGRLHGNPFSGLRLKHQLVTDTQTHVVLENCGISSVENGAFGESNIPQIIYLLSLSNNELRNIAALLELSTLVVLKLSGNKLTELPADMVSRLPLLQELHLADNLFSTVPSFICDFPAMSVTDFGGTNPISDDLSEFVDIFVKCERGIELGWGQATMNCQCERLYHQFPATNTKFTISARCSNDVCGTNQAPVICGPRSDVQLVAEKLIWLDTAEVWELCTDKNSASKMADKMAAMMSTIFMLLTYTL